MAQEPGRGLGVRGRHRHLANMGEGPCVLQQSRTQFVPSTRAAGLSEGVALNLPELGPGTLGAPLPAQSHGGLFLMIG